MHAHAYDSLCCRIISIHNNPENLQVPKGFQHLKMTVADVHTQDITPYFNPSYDYIEEARLGNQGAFSTPARLTATP